MIVKLLKPLLTLIIAGITAYTVDRGYGSMFVIVNDSSHEIEIKCDKAGDALKIPETVTIASGNRASFPCGCYEEGFTKPIIIRVIVVFDSNISVEHICTTKYHSICNSSEYVFEQTGKYEGTFTFAFADEDYEYALSQQTVE
ncbi:MAG: hypothetical protein J6K28_01340 [Alistipes sp.]|nr:hypothetical protein [Alistipes sp.]